jgi:prevent-host-death family protein
VDRVGIRELRNQVAAVVRRAAAGERIVITVDGVATAQLGPLEPTGGPSLDDLAAVGLVTPPPRRGRAPATPAAGRVPVDVRVDRLLDDLRGH